MDTGRCPVCSSDADELQRHASACGDKSRLRQLSRNTSGAVIPASNASPKRQPANLVLAKAHSTYAVVGRVCWFCLRSEPNLRSLLETVYGGLPILYHSACIAGLTEHTDNSLLEAYKIQAAERPAALAHTSTVGLSAMRSLSTTWLRGKRPPQTVFSDYAVPVTTENGKRHAEEGDTDDDSEDDATPLLHLAKKSCVSVQLAARRTPFQKQTVEPNAIDSVEGASPQLVDTPVPTCTDSHDCKASLTSVRPSPFANEAVMQTATSGVQQQNWRKLASQIFGNRPGFSWEFSGYVEAVPPVGPEEKRVLSHHMSSRTTRMYDKAQDGAAMDIKVLQFYEECGPGEWSPGFRKLLQANVKQYLRQDMQRRHVSWLLTNLPEDPDCSELLEVRPVQEGDFRKGLRPGVDVTVHAKDKIPQGTVLGLYRNITVTKAEENIIHDNPPERFEGTANEWRQKLDAYTTDIVQPGEGTRSRRLFKTYFEDSLKNMPLTCLAYMNGNILSCINDGVAEPFRDKEDPLSDEEDPLKDEDQPQDKPANVALVAVAVGNWPFMFVVTMSQIAQGEELFLSYGPDFWAIQKRWNRAIMEDRKREMEIEQRFRASGAFTLDSQGGSQLQKARSGPAVETAMSANHGFSGPLHNKPLQHAATAPADAGLNLETVASQDLLVAMDENDRQEAAADNQVELQKHESNDDKGDLQQCEAKEDAATMDGPVLSAHGVQEVDGIGPPIKKAKKEVVDSPSRSRSAAVKVSSPASNTLPDAIASTEDARQLIGRAGQQGDSNTLDQPQPSSDHSVAHMKPVLIQQHQDMEVAIMQSSSHSKPLQSSHAVLGFGSVNAQRSCWAPPGSIDIESISGFAQTTSYKAFAEHQRTGTTVSQFALFAPERKWLRVKQAKLGLSSSNRLGPDGEQEQGSAARQPRRVPNAVDQTHQLDAQTLHGQSAHALASPQQDQAGELRLLQSGAEQGMDTSAEQQRHLGRIISRTGSTLTQPGIPLSEAGTWRQMDAMHRDARFEDMDMFKRPDPTDSSQRPTGAASSKLGSFSSRSNPPHVEPPAIMLGQCKTAASLGKASQRSGKKKRLRESDSGRLLHIKQPPGPSRLSIKKADLAKQPDAECSAMPLVNVQSDSKTQSKPSGSGQVFGIVSAEDGTVALKGQPAEQKASARHAAVTFLKIGKPGSIVTKHSASFGLKASTNGTRKS